MSNMPLPDLAERLDRSIDELLTIRVSLASVPSSLPSFALDEALRQHNDFQQAKRTYETALEGLLSKTEGCQKDAILDMESATNAMLALAAEAAWQFGIKDRSAGISVDGTSSR